MRRRGYFYWQRKRAIARKSEILRELHGPCEPDLYTGGKPGKLSKGKIHCSCPLCRAKTYDHPSHSDMIKLEALSYREEVIV